MRRRTNDARARHRTPRLHRLGAHADACARRATRSSASTRSSSEAATSATRREWDADARARPARRRARRTSRASMRSSTSAALSNDPLGDLDPGWTYDINRDGAISLRRGGKGGRSAGVSSSRPRAACTARSTATGSLDETAPLRPLTPYAESKVRAEEAIRDLADVGLRPGVHAQRDRLRRLAATATRRRAQQPRRVGAHDRGDQAAERRDVVASARPRPGHRRSPSRSWKRLPRR